MKRLPASFLLALLLLAGIVATGALLVTTTHEARLKFRELEGLRREHDRMRGEWSALQIEVSTLAAPSTIDDFARRELGMVDPGQRLEYVEVSR
jgi:cell division protein FtsL